MKSQTKKYQAEIAVIIEQARIELDGVDFINEMQSIQSHISAIIGFSAMQGALLEQKTELANELRKARAHRTEKILVA
jgi:hypothetical protein